MIRSFSHKGLSRLYEQGNVKGISASLVPKVSRVLARLDVVTAPEQMNLPGWRLHPLKGELKGFWSIWLSANWRIIFRFRGTDVFDVDLIDYH